MKLKLESDEAKMIFACLPLIDEILKAIDKKEGSEYIECRLKLREEVHVFVKKLKEIGAENGI